MEREAERAAARLKHDLGKAIRFTAPETTEMDSGALRLRLSRDVLATRSGAEDPRPAWEVFETWRREAGDLFPPARLASLAALLAELKLLGSRLPELARPELERLDALTRTIAEDCRRLAAETAAGAGKP